MIRFIAIPEEDVLADAESAGAMLLRAVRRTDRLFFRAAVPLGETLLVCFETRARRPEDRTVSRFIFSPFRSLSVEETAAAVRARETAGETLLAAFPIGSGLWGLYAEYQTDEDVDRASGTCR